MSNLPVIDPEAIESLRSINPDDGGEFVREILGIFIEDTPARIQELDEAFQCSDIPKFIRAAHSIKGSSSNVGAMILRETAEELERLSRDQGLANLETLMEKLKSDYELTALKIAQLS